MDEMWLAFDVGCAECSNWPLVGVLGSFDSMELAAEAMKDAAGYEWREHPQGGYVKTQGDGGTWIVPVSALTRAEQPPIWNTDERDSLKVNLYA